MRARALLMRQSRSAYAPPLRPLFRCAALPFPRQREQHNINNNNHNNANNTALSLTTARCFASPIAAQKTPAMKQYLALKAKHPEFLLLFRLGDFFECFFSDAERAAEALSITLTARHGVPMCGFPARSLDTHLTRLVQKGFLIAVCDQVETAVERDRRKKRLGGKPGSDLIRREVTRLVTPGTLLEDRYLHPRQSNFLLSICAADSYNHINESEIARGTDGHVDSNALFGLAWVDLSTGEFKIAERSRADVRTELARLDPSEVVVPRALFETDHDLREMLAPFHVTRRDDRVPVEEARVRVSSFIRNGGRTQNDNGKGSGQQPGNGITVSPEKIGDTIVSSKTSVGDAAGHILGNSTQQGGKEEVSPSGLELSATAMLLRYLDVTQMGRETPLESPVRIGVTGRDIIRSVDSAIDPLNTASSAVSLSSQMMIDPASRHALELTHTVHNERVGSLLWVLDHTVTAGGARLLATQLGAPLTDTMEINCRLDAVEWFVRMAKGSPLDQQALADLRTALKQSFDILRCTQRILLGRGTPKDLSDVATTLKLLPKIDALLSGAASEANLPLPSLVLSLLSQLRCPSYAMLVCELAAIDSEPPMMTNEGGFIAPGTNAELDELRRIRDDTQSVIDELQQRYREDTGAKSLRVKRNNILGYHIEVTAAQRSRIEPFLHIDVSSIAESEQTRFRIYQSTANHLKLKSQELIDLEVRLSTAHDDAINLENQIFKRLCALVSDNGTSIRAAAHALAGLDVSASLARLAAKRGYVRPVLMAANNADAQHFHVIGGRHAILEAIRGDAGEPFVSNDCLLSSLPGSDTFQVITGPNMGGKSTYLRQNATIAVLAQMGSFVPAIAASLAPVDAIFSRLGAADDVSNDRSTFMVEMLETAHILNHASPRSMVIMDEVGRGTSTHDGLAIAWAVTEYLHERVGCRTLFATHYHEMSDLSERRGIAAKAMAVHEGTDGEVLFLYKLEDASHEERSLGVHIARLAGMPESVIDRASSILGDLQKGTKPSKVSAPK